MGQLDKIEIKENAIGDLAITCPGGGSHTLLKYDSDTKTFRDVLGNTTETVRTATSAWGIVKNPDWEFTFGPDSGNGTFNGDGTGMVMNTAKLDVFPIEDKNFKEANLEMQTGLIDDPGAYTQLPGLNGDVLIGGRYRVARFSPIWQSMEILERPRGDGTGQTKNFFCPNSRIRSLDFSENNGFALIYDGIGSAPVIKYPVMEKVNTRIEDEREYGDEIPGDYSKNRNEFTITSSAVFNHFREICTFLDSPVDASKIYTTETESKNQFTVLLPRPYTQICVLKSQAHSKKP
jgi:hypothetical protein